MKHILKSLLAVALVGLSFTTNTNAQFTPTPLAEKGFDVIGTAGVASVAVGTAGTGYTSLPAVSYTGGWGGGNPPTSTATLKVVGSITVTAGGTGYTVGDVLTIVGGTKSAAATITVAAISGGGGTGPITSYTLTTAGVYTVPVLTTGAATTGGTGTGATVTVGYGVGTVVVTDEGTGYTSAPTVVFTGGAGANAAGTATLNAAATAAHTGKFRSILPITDTVLSDVTFPGNLGAGSGVYLSHSGIVGKTLKAGVEYQVFANSVTPASGVAILVRR